MGVYIKGMEMPKNCHECPLSEEEFVQCKITRKRFLKAVDAVSRRHPYCPLVEIPPHGRLIDADALYRTIDATSERTIGHTTFKETVLLDIRGMPTILESAMGQVNSEKAIIEAERVVAKMRTTEEDIDGIY